MACGVFPAQIRQGEAVESCQCFRMLGPVEIAAHVARSCQKLDGFAEFADAAVGVADGFQDRRLDRGLRGKLGLDFRGGELGGGTVEQLLDRGVRCGLKSAATLSRSVGLYGRVCLAEQVALQEGLHRFGFLLLGDGGFLADFGESPALFSESSLIFGHAAMLALFDSGDLSLCAGE